MNYEESIVAVKENWEALRSLQASKKEEYGDCQLADTPFGQSHWDNKDLVWVYLTSNEEDNEEDYEGSQTQLGVTRDGRVLYEFQSHCSCNGYENSHGDAACPMPDDTTKTYELNEVPKEWKVIVTHNVGTMLALLNK